MDQNSQIQLQVTRLPGNNLVLKQTGGYGFFIAAPNHITISISKLAYILKFLVESGIMDKQVLEGVLEEINSDRGKIS